VPDLFDVAWAANRWVGASPELYALLKRLYDRFRGAPDVELRRILEGNGASSAADVPDWPEPTRGRVLFFSPRYWPEQVSWQLVVAWALRAEGYAPEFVTCGGAARICDAYAAEMRKGGFCTYCDRSLRGLLAPTGFRQRPLGDFIDADSVRAEARERVAGLGLDACRSFREGSVPIGKLVEPSVARSLRQVCFEPDALTLALYRGFLETALVNLRGLERILDEPWAFAFMLNGKFLAESLLLHLASERGLDYVTYERGFRVDTLFFAVNDQVTDFDISRHFEQVKNVPVAPPDEQRLQEYEAQRRSGEQAIIQYFPEIDENRRTIVEQFGIDTRRRIAVAFPNIVWDTAVFGHERAFESIWDWVRTTIEIYRESEDWSLIVRIHPAEVRLPARTRESMATLIERHFGELPRHVHLIPADSQASSYVFLELAERVLVYSSTMGLEAAMQGMDVVTAAKAHYAELGFTRDAHDPDSYLELLAAPEGLEPKRVREQARRYANLFFHRFQIPVKSVEELALSRPRYRFASLGELLSGSYPEVEFVRRSLLPLEDGTQLLPDEPRTRDAP
jgi:hypothetical protein